MVCVLIKPAGKATAHSTEVVRIANVGDLCVNCHEQIRAILTKRNNVPENTDIQGYLPDYIKIYALLSSDTICQDKITEFGQRISEHAGKQRGLSFHLKRFETLCHFPDIEVIPTGVLSPDEFYDMVARGVMWKDVGAGLTHGLYAHRLQWHIVLAVITNGFTIAKADGWDHGGYDLFVSMGVEGRAFNIWGKTFDASDSAAGFLSPQDVERKVHGISAVSSRIDNKYKKYHEAFKNITNYAYDQAKIRVGPENVMKRDIITPVWNEITDAIWATYYFGRRNIKAALPEDRTEYKNYSKAQTGIIGFKKPRADDRSKRFSPRNVTVENKTVRLQDQIMPSAAVINGLRAASGAALNRSPVNHVVNL